SRLDGRIGGGLGGAGGLDGDLGQGRPVDLAVAVERQPVVPDDCGGDHVVGQFFAEGLAEVARRGAAGGVGGDEVGDQDRARGRPVGDDGGLLDRVEGGQAGLDVAGFDPVAVDLDLEVDAAEDVDRSEEHTSELQSRENL